MAYGIEKILEGASGQVSVWFAGHVINGARIASWNHEDGILVCRGGNGFTDEDVHYIRMECIQGVTLRVPAPRPGTDRLTAETRDAIRAAAGYPVSLAIHPGAFANAPDPLRDWLENIAAGIGQLKPYREAFQGQIDQILLREGSSTAVLGGSTLILEATPQAIPAAEEIRAIIAALL